MVCMIVLSGCWLMYCGWLLDFGACVVWVFAGLRGAGLVVCVDGWLGCLAISFWLVVCVIAGGFCWVLVGWVWVVGFPVLLCG